jgi:malonyl-CoA O-methyltransferase
MRIDARQVRRNFERAAPRYDAAAFLPREVGRRMLERLDCVKFDPKRVLDLGCGTGADLHALSERYPNAAVVGADFCERMLREGRSRRSISRWLLPRLLRARAPLVLADAGALPFAGASIGLVWSNMMLHWSANPLLVFQEALRVLEPGGLLMFSTLGPGTLRELRACFTDACAHTLHFTDMHDTGDMLVECGFIDPVLDVETLRLTYRSLKDLVTELRQNGATCAAPDRRRALMGRDAWRAVENRFREHAVDGRLPATFEVIYGHAIRRQKTEDRRQKTEKLAAATPPWKSDKKPIG